MLPKLKLFPIEKTTHHHVEGRGYSNGTMAHRHSWNQALYHFYLDFPAADGCSRNELKPSYLCTR